MKEHMKHHHHKEHMHHEKHHGEHMHKGKDMINKSYYNKSESSHEKPIHTEMGNNPKWRGM